MQGRPGRKTTISLRMSGQLLREVDDLVARSGLRSRTELIERAVEAYVEELKTTNVVLLRAWTDRTARSAVLKFLRGRPSAYVSEIVEALGMEPELAWRVVDRLAAEGAIE